MLVVVFPLPLLCAHPPIHPSDAVGTTGSPFQPIHYSYSYHYCEAFFQSRPDNIAAAPPSPPRPSTPAPKTKHANRRLIIAPKLINKKKVPLPLLLLLLLLLVFPSGSYSPPSLLLLPLLLLALRLLLLFAVDPPPPLSPCPSDSITSLTFFAASAVRL